MMDEMPLAGRVFLVLGVALLVIGTALFALEGSAGWPPS